ncbi:MAG: hypothetical protein K8L99_09650, partial [Anaerolineae bacterium]|nr:hypothetical protein [Anaerolineae bacterium]
DKARVRARARTLSAAVEGVQITWQVVAESIAQGFARAFDVTWEVDELSNAELAAAERLATAVYGSPEWLYRR